MAIWSVGNTLVNRSVLQLISSYKYPKHSLSSKRYPLDYCILTERLLNIANFQLFTVEKTWQLKIFNTVITIYFVNL
jgi:hypothetical protein